MNLSRRQSSHRLAILVCTLIVACAPQPDIEEAAADPELIEWLDAKRPFGLELDNPATDENEPKKTNQETCDSNQPLFPDIPAPSDAQPRLEHCLSLAQRFYLPNEEVPSPFQEDGFVSYAFNHLGNLAIVEYSYLHFSHPSKKHTALRIQHAATLRRALLARYGAPLSTGYFDQMEYLGFIPREGKDNPCEFWFHEQLGVFLCTERVTLIDGIEMSLSFVNFDQLIPPNHLVPFIQSSSPQTELEQAPRWPPSP